MRILIIIIGIVIAAFGGAIAYRALFLEPAAAVVITNTEVRELPDTLRVLAGVGLFILGTAIALGGALRRGSKQ